MPKAVKMVGFSRLSEDPFGSLSRFEAFIKVALGLPSSDFSGWTWSYFGWLAASRVSCLQQVPKAAQMVGFSRLSEDPFGTLSRFEAFIKVALGLPFCGFSGWTWGYFGWLAASGVSCLQQVPKAAQMVGFSKLSEDPFGTLSRFEAFIKVALGLPFCGFSGWTWGHFGWLAASFNRCKKLHKW